MIETHPLPRPEWLKWRQGGYGGSDVSSILGISPHGSPFSVWADKSDLIPIDADADNEAMEFGRWAELMLGPWFESKTGLHLVSQQARVTSDDHPRHLATLDGLVVDPRLCTHGGDCPIWSHPNSIHGDLRLPIDLELALGTGEIKTDFAGTPWASIPPWYQSQGQWQMHATGLERCWFIVLHGRRMRTYVLERDQRDIDYMVERVDEFHADHVATGIAPAIDSSEATAKALTAVWPTDDRAKAVELNEEQVDALHALARAKADAKKADVDSRHASNILKAAAGDAYTLTVNDVKVATVGSQTKKKTCEHCGAVDESKPFRVLRPVKAKKVKA